MRKHLATAALSIVATLLLGIGIAVAVEGPRSDVPDTNSVASSHSESSDTESSDTDSSKSETESSDVSTDSSDSSDSASAANSTSSDHPENHGKYVSQAAHDCPAGAAHGPCVAAVAQSDQGKPQH